MKSEITKIIESKIKSGIEKNEIQKELSLKYNKYEYLDILANYPDIESMRKYKKLNNLLIIIISILFVFKIILLSNINLNYFIIGLIILIFIYTIILKGLFLFKHTTYFNILMLTLLGLMGSINSFEQNYLYIIDISLGLIIAIITFYLIKKIYKKNNNK